MNTISKISLRKAIIAILLKTFIIISLVSIIKSFYDDNKHCKLYIDDEVHDMYDFAKTNLKIYIKPPSIIADEKLNSELDAGIFLD